MEIDFADYLSEDERKEIVASVFRSHCLEKIKADHERIFSNAAYAIVLTMVNESFDGKAVEMVATKTKEVIAELSEYTVFTRKGYYEKEDSEGYKALCAAIQQHKPTLDARISAIIENLDENDMRETIKDVACDLVDEKLFGKKGGAK